VTTPRLCESEVIAITKKEMKQHFIKFHISLALRLPLLIEDRPKNIDGCILLMVDVVF
jgi:hypothetical protein